MECVDRSSVEQRPCTCRSGVVTLGAWVCGDSRSAEALALPRPNEGGRMLNRSSWNCLHLTIAGAA
eukprot:9395465-Lingulodinium_polyedra.AAC.2